MRKSFLIGCIIALLICWYGVEFVKDVELNETVFIRSLSNSSASIVAFSKNSNYAQLLFYPEFSYGSKRTIMRSDFGHINHNGEHLVLFELNALQENTTYYYHVLFSENVDELDSMAELLVDKKFEHKFHTFPSTSKSNSAKSLRFAFGSCLSTDPIFSMNVFRQWKDLNIDFSIIHGDLVYDDVPNFQKRDGRSYRRLLSDPHFKNLFSQIPLFAQVDDHEFGNNYQLGSETDVYRKGAYYFDSYLGQKIDPSMSSSEALDPVKSRKPRWYTFSFGQYEFFILDVRSHRTKDTMLGSQQKQELFEWLYSHKAAPWKFIITPVSLTTKQSWLADGWHGGRQGEASGILEERQEIFDFIFHQNLTHSTIFLSGDTHNAHVNRFHQIAKTQKPQQQENEQTNIQQIIQPQQQQTIAQTQAQQMKNEECQSENCNYEITTTQVLLAGDSTGSISDLPIISVHHSEPLVKQTEKNNDNNDNHHSNSKLSPSHNEDPSKFSRLQNGSSFYEFAVSPIRAFPPLPGFSHIPKFLMTPDFEPYSNVDELVAEFDVINTGGRSSFFGLIDVNNARMRFEIYSNSYFSYVPKLEFSLELPTNLRM